MTEPTSAPSPGAGPEPAREPVPEALTTADPPPDELVWQRVHPLTPVVKSWKALVAVLAVISWQAVEFYADFAEEEEFVNVGDFLLQGGWRLVVAGLVTFAILVAVISTLAWRFTRYAVSDEALHLHTGVLFRQQRQARLDRLQTVDVVRPLLARLAGLSQLTLEVAGAGDTNVALSFLKHDDAARLRAELLARAAGLQRRPAPAGAHGTHGAAAAIGADGLPVPGAGAPGDAPLLEPALEAPEQQVFDVPTGRLVGSIAASGVSIFLVITAVVATAAAVLNVVTDGFGRGAFTVGFGEALFLIPAAIGVISAVWSQFSKGFNFRAAISPDGIRLRHGLLETRAQTIAPGRVQAVQFVQPVLWRRFGWWRGYMNVAGYGSALETADGSSTTLLPVGSAEEVALACWMVLPDLGVADPRAVLTEALLGTGDEEGFTLQSQRTRWLDPWVYRRRGFRVTDRALILRSGRLRRTVTIVPHERTQSLGAVQGPIDRGLKVASFVVHSMGGPVAPQIDHLDLDVLHDLLQEQAARAREARARDLPEQWLRQTQGGA